MLVLQVVQRDYAHAWLQSNTKFQVGHHRRGCSDNIFMLMGFAITMRKLSGNPVKSYP